MLKNGVVTLFTLDAEGKTFVKKGTYPAWVHKKSRLRNTEDGVYGRDSFDIRIELGLLTEVTVGDLVFFGEMTEEDFSVADCRKIAVATQNNFGNNPHWHLQAEYEYR